MTLEVMVPVPDRRHNREGTARNQPLNKSARLDALQLQHRWWPVVSGQSPTVGITCSDIVSALAAFAEGYRPPVTRPQSEALELLDRPRGAEPVKRTDGRIGGTDALSKSRA